MAKTPNLDLTLFDDPTASVSRESWNDNYRALDANVPAMIDEKIADFAASGGGGDVAFADIEHALEGTATNLAMSPLASRVATFGVDPTVRTGVTAWDLQHGRFKVTSMLGHDEFLEQDLLVEVVLREDSGNTMRYLRATNTKDGRMYTATTENQTYVQAWKPIAGSGGGTDVSFATEEQALEGILDNLAMSPLTTRTAIFGVDPVTRYGVNPWDLPAGRYHVVGMLGHPDFAGQGIQVDVVFQDSCPNLGRCDIRYLRAINTGDGRLYFAVTANESYDVDWVQVGGSGGGGGDEATIIREIGYRINNVWTQRDRPAGYFWNFITYGNGLFVAATENSAYCYTSSDGITWTQRDMPVKASWNSIAYGNGVFVAVARGTAYCATSPDGITWTQRDMPINAYWTSVTYGNGVFVAITSNYTHMVTSPDGITWTQRTSTDQRGWNFITYGNGLFVAVGYSSVCMTSSDSITWTQRDMPEYAQRNSVAYGNGVFVAVATKPYCDTSPDGITWTQRNMPSDEYWTSVTYGNGLFVAVAGSYASSNICATSPDGITWTRRTLPMKTSWQSVAYGNGAFVAVAIDTDNVATSPWF